MGGRCHTSQQTFSISNDKDSVLQPPLSGFLGLGVSVATLLLRWTHGQRTRVAGYGHQQPTGTPMHQPSAKLSRRAQRLKKDTQSLVFPLQCQAPQTHRKS